MFAFLVFPATSEYLGFPQVLFDKDSPMDRGVPSQTASHGTELLVHGHDQT